jgi:hypothetical protein
MNDTDVLEAAVRHAVPAWFMLQYCRRVCPSSGGIGGIKVRAAGHLEPPPATQEWAVRFPGRLGDRLFHSLERAAEAVAILVTCDRTIDGTIRLAKFVELHSTQQGAGAIEK